MKRVEKKLLKALCKLDEETVKSVTLYKWTEDSIIAV